MDRRDFLAASAAFALAPAALPSAAPPRAKRVLFIQLTGGPSQIDTWDPKPDAACSVAGPFDAIQTNVAGIHLSELFPGMAKRMDKFSLIRSMTHDLEPTHEAGERLLDSSSMQSGFRYQESLHPGDFRKAMLRTERNDSLFVLPHFGGILDSITWDCHAAGGCLPTTLDHYKSEVAPAFDKAFCALIDDLEECGRLRETLVVAVGEMGRTPYMNARGGRDHWTRCWTAIVAGGGVRGGQVVGETDKRGGEVKDRPVHPRDLLATILHATGKANDGVGKPVLELF